MRIVAMAVTIALMSLLLWAPFINVLAWRGGARWLAVYLAVLALATIAVSLAIMAVVAMFRAIGPRRTRLIAQIVAAFIGAIFAVSLQVGAIQSFGTPDRMAFLRSPAMLSIAPESDSPLWGIAYAAMGCPVPLALLVAVAVLGLGAVIAVFAPRFPQYVLEAGGIAQGHRARGGPGLGTRAVSPSQMLRRKEWALLRRDPVLVSSASAAPPHPPAADGVAFHDLCRSPGVGELGGRGRARHGGWLVGRDPGRISRAGGGDCSVLRARNRRPPRASSGGGGHCEECIFALVRKRRAKAWASISVTGAKLADNSELTRWRHVF